MTYIANKSGLLLLSLQYLIFKNAFNYDETKFNKTDKCLSSKFKTTVLLSTLFSNQIYTTVYPKYRKLISTYACTVIDTNLAGKTLRLKLL